MPYSTTITSIQGRLDGTLMFTFQCVHNMTKLLKEAKFSKLLLKPHIAMYPRIKWLNKTAVFSLYRDRWRGAADQLLKLIFHMVQHEHPQGHDHLPHLFLRKLSLNMQSNFLWRMLMTFFLDHPTKETVPQISVWLNLMEVSRNKNFQPTWCKSPPHYHKPVLPCQTTPSKHESSTSTCFFLSWHQSRH